MCCLDSPLFCSLLLSYILAVGATNPQGVFPDPGSPVEAKRFVVGGKPVPRHSLFLALGQEQPLGPKHGSIQAQKQRPPQKLWRRNRGAGRRHGQSESSAVMDGCGTYRILGAARPALSERKQREALAATAQRAAARQQLLRAGAGLVRPQRLHLLHGGRAWRRRRRRPPVLGVRVARRRRRRVRRPRRRRRVVKLRP